MANSTNSILLREPDVEPTAQVLEKAMGKTVYSVYLRFMKSVTGVPGFSPEWRFYRDGKAWLCKATYKKKTVFWLSVWEQQFKVSFYFSEKTIEGIRHLQLSKSIHEQINSIKPVGKLFPVVIEVCDNRTLRELEAIMKYKMSL